MNETFWEQEKKPVKILILYEISFLKDQWLNIIHIFPEAHLILWVTVAMTP